jgi:Flp pilus assembly protein TadD
MKSKAVTSILSSVLMVLISVTVFAQQTADEYLKRGKELLEKKNYLQAQENFEKAIELNPNLAEAYYFRGRVQLDDKKADADFTKAIELKPDYAHAYNALGYSLADRNLRLTEALQLIEKARQLAPDDAFILDSLGWVRYRLGDLKLARENLQAAYTARPDAEVAVHLAEVLWTMGEQDAARKLLREVRAKEPTNPLLKSTVTRLRIGL